MGTYQLDSGTAKNSNRLKARVHGNAVREDGTGNGFQSVQFTSATGQTETFVIELRPGSGFSSVTVLDAESTPFTEVVGSTTMTCQRMTFVAGGSTEFRTYASGSAPLLTPPTDLDPPPPPDDEVAIPHSDDSDTAGDDLPIRIKVRVVHPTA